MLLDSISNDENTPVNSTEDSESPVLSSKKKIVQQLPDEKTRPKKREETKDLVKKTGKANNKIPISKNSHAICGAKTSKKRSKKEKRDLRYRRDVLCKWFNRKVFKREGELIREMTGYNRRRHNKGFMEQLDTRAGLHLED